MAVTKYVCLIEGCNFATENKEEAMEHSKEHHDDVENAGARVSLDDEDNIECELI